MSSHCSWNTIQIPYFGLKSTARDGFYHFNYFASDSSFAWFLFHFTSLLVIFPKLLKQQFHDLQTKIFLGVSNTLPSNLQIFLTMFKESKFKLSLFTDTFFSYSLFVQLISSCYTLLTIIYLVKFLEFLKICKFFVNYIFALQ